VEIHKTSETLEQQILEDARRKASRVLEAAEKDARAIASEWEAKDRDEAARVDSEAEARCRALRQELESSLPLDFMRTRLAATEHAVRESLAELFTGMDGTEAARVLGRLLARATRAFAGTRVVVRCRGLDPGAARGLVVAALPGASVDEVREEPAGEEGARGRGLVVETADGRVRCRATLAELTDLLLEDRRAELVTALFGSAGTL
jgi:vacuolar-type H+-ATPase subunit E/Vma4